MKILESIKDVLVTEIEAIQDLADSLDETFEEAIHLILAAPRKIIITGMGKSGHIGTKIAATMCSTGTTAIFMHPSEGLHGDLGVVQEGDLLIMLSKSGESDEMIALIPSLKKMKCKVIVICANRESTLARHADVVLFTPIQKEACSLNLAPTSSTTVSLALGDALAVTLMREKGFTSQDFAMFHPAGRLGKRLLYLVDDLMKKDEEAPRISADATFEEVLTSISKGQVNATMVTDSENNLIGLITGYDLRRTIQEQEDLKSLTAKDMMTANPITIEKGTYAIQSYNMMRESTKSLLLLPVIDQGKAAGIITIQDLVRAGL